MTFLQLEEFEGSLEKVELNSNMLPEVVEFMAIIFGIEMQNGDRNKREEKLLPRTAPHCETRAEQLYGSEMCSEVAL